MTEILEGRGFEGPPGLDYLHLDLTHLGADKINRVLPLIREVCIDYIGLDPIEKPIPIRPVAHYSMGGIESDINGGTAMRGVWTAGEVACHSTHGANRLGCNSTMECLVYGAITGEEMVKYIDTDPPLADLPLDQVDAEYARLFEDLLQKKGKENPYDIKTAIRATMRDNMGVFRDGDSLKEGLKNIRELNERYRDIYVQDGGSVYNTNLTHVLETRNLLDVAEGMTMAALAREEIRGGHARTDFMQRDDEKWLKHTLITHTKDGPKLSYKPVTITKWLPVERKY